MTEERNTKKCVAVLGTGIFQMVIAFLLSRSKATEVHVYELEQKKFYSPIAESLCTENLKIFYSKPIKGPWRNGSGQILGIEIKGREYLGYEKVILPVTVSRLNDSNILSLK